MRPSHRNGRTLNIRNVTERYSSAITIRHAENQSTIISPQVLLHAGYGYTGARNFARAITKSHTSITVDSRTNPVRANAGIIRALGPRRTSANSAPSSRVSMRKGVNQMFAPPPTMARGRRWIDIARMSGQATTKAAQMYISFLRFVTENTTQGQRR